MNKRITALWKFLTYDIWRITEDEVTKTTFSLYNIIKTIYLCINRFTKDRLVNKASALTYSTLLAIVPHSCHPVCHRTRIRLRQSYGKPSTNGIWRTQSNDGSNPAVCQFLPVANQEWHIHRSGFNHVVMDGYQPDQQH